MPLMSSDIDGFGEFGENDSTYRQTVFTAMILVFWGLNFFLNIYLYYWCHLWRYELELSHVALWVVLALITGLASIIGWHVSAYCPRKWEEPRRQSRRRHWPCDPVPSSFAQRTEKRTFSIVPSACSRWDRQMGNFQGPVCVSHLHVPSVRHRRDRQTGRPSCFSETAYIAGPLKYHGRHSII